MFGLSEDQIQFLRAQILKPLERFKVSVWVYGSRAKGTHHPFSDVDIMVQGPAEVGVALAEIRESLSRSNFPFKVDLVDYREFATSYREDFERDKVPL